MDVAASRPSLLNAPGEGIVTSQRPVSALGWGLALCGGALGWAGLFALLR